MACIGTEWIFKYIKMPKHWLNEYLNIFGWPRIEQTNIRIYLDWGKATNTNMNDICWSFLKEYSCSSLLVYSEKICSFYEPFFWLCLIPMWPTPPSFPLLEKWDCLRWWAYSFEISKVWLIGFRQDCQTGKECFFVHPL